MDKESIKVRTIYFFGIFLELSGSSGFSFFGFLGFFSFFGFSAFSFFGLAFFSFFFFFFPFGSSPSASISLRMASFSPESLVCFPSGTSSSSSGSSVRVCSRRAKNPGFFSFAVSPFSAPFSVCFFFLKRPKSPPSPFSFSFFFFLAFFLSGSSSPSVSSSASMPAFSICSKILLSSSSLLSDFCR